MDERMRFWGGQHKFEKQAVKVASSETHPLDRGSDARWRYSRRIYVFVIVRKLPFLG